MTGSAAGRTWTRSQQSGSAGSGWGSWTQTGGGLGIGQAWQELTGSRFIGGNYTNSTSLPIAVSVNIQQGSGYGGYAIYVNGVKAVTCVGVANASHGDCFTIVPTGATYSLIFTGGTNAPTINTWSELR